MPRSEDIHIGQRIRQRRHSLGLTQQQVAEQIGTKFQQLQKYETGANHVSGSRLIDLGRALYVHPSYFFKGVDGPEPEQEIKDAHEATLLRNFRHSFEEARNALLRIAQETALISA